MSVKISGRLVNGAGEPMPFCKIILKAKANTAESIIRTIAAIQSDSDGAYSFEAQTGRYAVELQPIRFHPYPVGEIVIYPDSSDGDLNAFLSAISEEDLTPDAILRFESMVAQAQKSAEVATKSEQMSRQHAEDAEQAKERTETLAEEVQQNTDAVAGDRQRVEQLALEVSENAGQVQQGVQEATEAVKAAQQAAKKSATSAEESKTSAEESKTSAGESKTSADNAAQSELNAQQHALNAGQHAHQTAQDLQDSNTARAAAQRFAAESKKNAEATAADRAATAEDVKQSEQNAAASAQSAQDAKEYRDSAKQIVDGLNATNATTTQKGLVQLSSATDSDSEELAATPKAVKTVMDEARSKAPLNSPNFTGAPTAPTPGQEADGREIANVEYVKELINSNENAIALQSDIYDRANGRAALPGVFGFGAFYPETVEFSSHSGAYELKKWVKKTPPGRYAIVQKKTSNYTPIIPGVVFEGEVEIKILVMTTSAEHQNNEKIVIFYGINGEVYYNRLKPDAPGPLPGWENLKLDLSKDIYDRTSGRAALPGALGFGALYSKVETFSSTGGITSFKVWVKRTGPGRYFVSQAITDQYDPIINGEVFTGEVEIKILDEATVSDQGEKDKVVIFYGQQGCVYYNRLIYNGLSSTFTGWENLKNSPKDFVALQQSVSSDPYSSPVVGGLVLASHNIATINSNTTVHRGKIFRGSELQPVVLSADSSVNEVKVHSASMFTYPTDTFALVGSYAALFGEPTTPINNKRVIAGLFVRIA